MSKYNIPLFNTEEVFNQSKSMYIPNIDNKMQILKKWGINENIKRQSENQLVGEFFRDIFVNVLDYSTIVSNKVEWTLSIEQKTEVDGTKPDAIIGFYSANTFAKTQGVIELKGFNIDLDEKQKRSGKDYGTPVEQAFSYASKYDGCKWVLVSNLKEIRLYKVGRSQNYYEKFLLGDLQKQDEFKRFYLLLCKNNLLSSNCESFTEKLGNNTYNSEINITKEFYNKYKIIRIRLVHTIKNNNTYLNINECIRCSQKLLDRIIFICFCEGMNLIQHNELKNCIERGKISYSGIWNELKGLFRALDIGKQRFNINKFNGELFKIDNTLDNIIIPDDFFHSLNEIINYKFSYDINVEVLGHIFEQSVTDLEKLRKEFNGDGHYDNEGRRRREGIFYTPHKITKFIVERTLEKYIERKLIEIINYYNSIEIKPLKDIEGNKLGKDKSKELYIYETYRDKLRELKILDASCGSGAFLVEICDYLSKEYERVEKKISELKNNYFGQIDLFELNKQILSKNIYGVDLNEESVEITKLSLWLKTVEKNKPLLALNKHIRCGNSTISDSTITSKAFNWNQEFPEVIQNGGFDIIVGNPPYLKWFAISPRKPFEGGEYLKVKYSCRIHHKDSQPNLYMFFIILCMRLLKNNGILGFITSQEWLNCEKLNAVKEILLQNGTVNNIIFDSKYSVFADLDGTTIGTNSSILIYGKGTSKESTSNNIPLNEEEVFLNSGICSNMPYKISMNDKWNRYGLTSEKELIIHQINALESILLGDESYFGVFGGFQPPIKKAKDFMLTELEYLSVPQKERNVIYKVILNASSIDKYSIEADGVYWIVANEVLSEDDFITMYPYLSKLLRNRVKSTNNGSWYKFPNTRNLDKFTSLALKLVAPRTKKYNAFALDNSKYLFKGTNSAIYIKKGFDIKYVLGVLNSSLMTFWYKFEGDDYHGNTRKYEPKSVKRLKVPVVEKEYQDDISNKVEGILANTDKIYNMIKEFKKWIFVNYNISIDNHFYNYNEITFFNKYIKQKTRCISPKNLNLINSYLEEYKEECNKLIVEKNLLIQEIDKIIYNIYEISEYQKGIIEGFLQ